MLALSPRELAATLRVIKQCDKTVGSALALAFVGDELVALRCNSNSDLQLYLSKSSLQFDHLVLCPLSVGVRSTVLRYIETVHQSLKPGTNKRVVKRQAVKRIVGSAMGVLQSCGGSKVYMYADVFNAADILTLDVQLR